jgi:SOS response regulatory protein OraA/RecX
VTYLFGAKRGAATADVAATTESLTELTAAEKAAARQWAIESGEVTRITSPALSQVSEPHQASAASSEKRVRFEDLSLALVGDGPRTIEIDADEERAQSEAQVKSEAQMKSEAQAQSDRDGEADRAHNVALHALARRGVSVSEMRKLLKSRDLDEDTVENEIARLEGVALLDDNALAETLVRSLQERKGLGRSGVTNELRRRGIDQEAITLALESEDSGDEEAQRALELAMKRAPQLRSYDNETAKRRLSGFLMRRGYSGQVVSAAVTAALSGSGSSSSSRGPRFQ